MKTASLLLAGCFAATALLADEVPSFAISARYEGFDPTYLSDATGNETTGLNTPRVTTRAGQKATIEIIKEFIVISSAHDPERMNCGITLELEPNFKDGKIILSGKSTVRRLEKAAGPQPLNALSFTARETFFDGEVVDGKPFTIQTGDGAQDVSRFVLTVTRAPAEATHTSHAALPKLRLYAIEPSSEEIKNPFYITLGMVPPPAAEPARAQTPPQPSISPALTEVTRSVPDVEIRGIVDPVQEAASDTKSTLAGISAEALKPLAADDQPIQIGSSLSPDGMIVDLTLQPTAEPARKISSEVSTYWGSDVYLSVADATRPGGRRFLVLRQE